MGSGLDNPFVLWFVLTATLAGSAKKVANSSRSSAPGASSSRVSVRQ